MASASASHASRFVRKPDFVSRRRVPSDPGRSISKYHDRLPDRYVLFATVPGMRTLKSLGLEPHVLTPSGGAHVYFEHPGRKVNTVSGKSKRELGRWYPGLDLRGDDGYAIFCGHNTVGEYELVRNTRREKLSLLPDDLLRLLRLDAPPDRKPGIPQGTVAPETIIGRALALVGSSGRNEAGFWLARQLRDNGFSESGALVSCLQFQQRCPAQNTKGQSEQYTAAAVRASVASAYSRAPREPWGRRQSVLVFPGSESEDGQDAASAFNCTPLSTANLLVRWHGDSLRYCAAWGRWICWDGQRWAISLDSSGPHRKAVATVRRLYELAGCQNDTETRRKLASWAVRCETKSKLDELVGLAQKHEAIEIHPDQLDSDGWLLNVQNGTLDLRAGELREHRPHDFITKLCPVIYDDSASCPEWLKFLHRIFQGHIRVINFVRRAAGYSLTADTSEQVLFLLHGNGANGKSTLVETLMAMLGDYALMTPSETLLVRRNDGTPNDLARLKGARLVAALETEDGRRLAESRVKQMTGGDRIPARFLHGEWLDFHPDFKVWLATNHRPRIRGSDHAIWRRIRLIPFDYQIPEVDRDRRFGERLRSDELPGILRWALMGCLAWQASGLGTPEEVTRATEEYRSESDHLGRFVEENCVLDAQLNVRGQTLYSAYRSWASDCGEDTSSMTAFGRRVVTCGRITKGRSKTGVVYSGLGPRCDR